MQQNKQFHDQLSPSDFFELWLKSPLLNSENQKTFERYYRDYIKKFKNGLKRNYDNRLKDILEIINEKGEGIKILDIGSGCGTEALYFSTLGCKVVGIDLDEKRTNVARERKEILEKSLKRKLDCEFNIISVFDLKPEKFDIIWMMETFHHIEPREEFVSLLPKILNDNGNLAISESNASNPLIQLLMFKARGFSIKKIKKDANGIVHQYGRERIIRAKTLEKILKKSGIHCDYTRYFRIFFPWNRLLKEIEGNKSSLLKPLFIHYNFIGSKRNTK